MRGKILPTTYFFLLLFLLFLTHFFFPIKRIIFPPYNYFGILFVVLGVVLNLWTSLFKKNKTTVKPHETPSKMITSGPYKFTRNPMYLGMSLLFFGLAIFLGSLVAFSFPLLFIILMDATFIPQEEKNLERRFGKKYIEYKNKVRRWI